MSPRKKTILLILAIGIFILVGCSGESTPTPTPTGLLGLIMETEDPNQGWATILYKWEDNQPPGWKVAVDVEIEVIIERDKNNPGRYVVHGSRGTIYYIQVDGGGGGGPCVINCDYEAQYYAEGEVVQISDVEGGNCQIPIKLDPEYGDVKRSGTCMKEAVENYGCAEVFLIFAEEGSNWTFDEDNQVIEKMVSQGQVHRAEIKNVQWPKELEKVCKWD